MSLTTFALIGIVALSSPQDNPSPEDLSLVEALEQGQFQGSIRGRYQDVNQAGAQAAQAPTLRARVAYETGPFNYLSLFAEYTTVMAIPDDDNYNSGANGQLDDAFIADPEQSFFSRYGLALDASNTLIKYGRQGMTLDNGRFLGAQEHRQAASSLSGLSVRNESLNFLRVRFGEFYRFESPLNDKVEGGQQSIQARYFNTEYRGFINSLLSVYAYDIKNESGNDLWSSRTYGIRFAGDIKNEPRIQYAFEYARQKDAYDNPSDYSESYYLMEFAARYKGVRISTGREVLGAGEQGYVVTPLADLHRFQGLADVFAANGLGNVASGVQDRYAGLGYFWSDETKVELTYHDYHADRKASGLDRLGHEYNIELSYQTGRLRSGLRFSDYHARDLGLDTQTSWFDLEFSF